MRKLDGKTLAAPLWLASSVLLLCSLAQTAQAQEETDAAAPPPAPRQRDASRRDDAASLLLQLNLSPEQRAQLIEIRTQNMSEGQALARRLNQARRALDAAIYADTVDEAVIEERARAVADAQSAVVRMRALTELRVRRVLTPEQLNLFRQLRREASLRQRRERRSRRRGEDDNNSGRAPRGRPLFDDRLNRRPNSPPDATNSSPAGTRRPKP